MHNSNTNYQYESYRTCSILQIVLAVQTDDAYQIINIQIYKNRHYKHPRYLELSTIQFTYYLQPYHVLN